MARTASKETSIEYAGRTYAARWRMADEMLHVDGGYGSASALLNGQHNSPELLAQMLLYGLAQAWNRNHRRHGPEALSA